MTGKSMGRLAILALIPFLVSEGLRLLAGAAFQPTSAAYRWGFFAAVLVLAAWTRPFPSGNHAWIWPRQGLALVLLFILSLAIYLWAESTIAAWLLVGLALVLWLAASKQLTHHKQRLVRWGLAVSFGLAAGLALVAGVQIETHFADEEFFEAVQVIIIAVLWLILYAILAATPNSHHLNNQPLGFCLPTLPAYGILLLVGLSGLYWTVIAYQGSFFPDQAPSYPGITAANPFVCEELDTQPVPGAGGEAVFDRILARLAANPQKSAPEWAMLALGRQDLLLAQQFHDSLLNEARQAAFTGPANSVKSVQAEAALRAYYYPRMIMAFPGLFTLDEQEEIRAWFAAINRRAQTIEWVDWMYALAFSKAPEGPYENQENGAGLLALLELDELADPALSSKNLAYLDRSPRGWAARFRNTDDALVYQPEWIYNAYYQSLWSVEANSAQMALSFEWLLLQALPDGSPLLYNHPAAASPAGIAYLGATLLQDPRYIWWSDRALERLEETGRGLSAKPGVEQPVDLAGEAPQSGSCLLFGGSGLPNQLGPLAPDKVIFRSGWDENDRYLMLNLRFSGWHRYKATNAIILFYQDGPLVVEQTQGQPFPWLPTGRSLFRDKRIPRQNLNGLLVERTGLSAVLYDLAGTGGPWAQDPPYYASIQQFETSEAVDASTTRIDDWRGWQHSRQILFYSEEVTVVADQAILKSSRLTNREAAISWHLPPHPGLATLSYGPKDSFRWVLREGEQPAQMVVLPVEPVEKVTQKYTQDDETGINVLYQAKDELSIATVFLTGEWATAQVTWSPVAAQPTLLITSSDGQVLTAVLDRHP